GAFDLARSPLLFQRAQRQPQARIGARELAEERLHQIHARLRVVGVAGIRWTGCERPAAHPRNADVLVAQALLQHPGEIPLDLEPDHELELPRAEPLELLLEEVPGREMERRAV